MGSTEGLHDNIIDGKIMFLSFAENGQNSVLSKLILHQVHREDFQCYKYGDQNY